MSASGGTTVALLERPRHIVRGTPSVAMFCFKKTVAPEPRKLAGVAPPPVGLAIGDAQRPRGS
eukprot:6327732-Lingulodinium_polyedra.AAC.1